MHSPTRRYIIASNMTLKNHSCSVHKAVDRKIKEENTRRNSRMKILAFLDSTFRACIFSVFFLVSYCFSSSRDCAKTSRTRITSVNDTEASVQKARQKYAYFCLDGFDFVFNVRLMVKMQIYGTAYV